MSEKRAKMNRRQFIKRAAVTGAAAVAGFPTIVKASALGKDGAVAPSNRIVMAGIGFGMMGPGNMSSFLEKPEVQWVAVCDLDKEPLAMAQDMVNKKYGNKACATYHDFRELYFRKDLDAVSIAVPDHWHAILSISALRAGLDVYGEKPLTHNLREGRALCDAVERYGRVWQTGSWQRSVENFHQASELVRNGRIGKVKRIEVGLPSGHYDFAGTFGQEALAAPPPNLDYEFWIGPAPWWPYCKARVHMNWRWNMDFGGGQYMDWIGHHLDIAHWGMGWDGTGPVEIEATGEFPTSGIYNSPTRYYVQAKYADGTPMVLAGGHSEIWGGTKWIGEYGWIWVDRGQFETEPASLKREVIGPGEIRLTKSRDHYQNFLDCVRSRTKTIAPAETAHRSASVGHLGVVAMEVGRKIKWHPATETIIGDPEAERLLGHSYRKPWQMPE
ncbi:MAG: dehydrogenase [Candidatus Aminicenantes bacterium RBG_19FT_COMBO_65_30]|nr:MAG: dehydrogenase [Candidatus Aminicenantes bacterium RBG_19FT_COMBO_65_30]